MFILVYHRGTSMRMILSNHSDSRLCLANKFIHFNAISFLGMSRYRREHGAVTGARAIAAGIGRDLGEGEGAACLKHDALVIVGLVLPDQP